MEMMEELAKHGLFFDYLYNLRVLEPNIADDTSDLKEKSGEYTESKLMSNIKFWCELNCFIDCSIDRIAGIPQNNRRIH